jgi:hypothetical protein
LILTLLDSHRRQERHHGEYAGMSGVQCWINADEELQPEEKTTANGECLPVHAILASRSSGDYAEICAGHGGKVEIAGEIRLAFDGGEDARDRSGNNP